MIHRTTFLAAPLLATLTSTAFAEPSDLGNAHYWLDEPQLTTTEKPTDLAEIAAADPALTYTEGEGDAPDSMSMLSDVMFAFGDADLAPDALATLDSVAKNLADGESLRIIGHTDSIGSTETNLWLGEQRAESVREWFLNQGDLSAETIEIDSKGEAEPVADNVTPAGLDNAKGRAMNRRVEFQIITAGSDQSASASTPHPTIF